MERRRFTIVPRSAFGTRLKGDTLFGQLCWAIINLYGTKRLEELLEGYTSGQPFMVIGDGFPAGYLPRPQLPQSLYEIDPGEDRKTAKKRIWLALQHSAKPTRQWHALAVNEKSVLRTPAANATTATSQDSALMETHSATRNSINRMTGTTGTDFAPYSVEQIWFATGLELDVYTVFDEQRITADELDNLVGYVGSYGYGRDASTGMGKFDYNAQHYALASHPQANALLTLAPCAPQGLDCSPENSWYTTFNRFGRHGDAAVLSARPFKTPLLLADTAAVLGFDDMSTDNTPAFYGQGLGGKGELSKAIPATVHQGYAPILPVFVEHARDV